jgi:hypothetical protein
MPEFRTAVMTLVEASWHDPSPEGMHTNQHSDRSGIQS